MSFVTERISDEEFLKHNIAKTCYGDQAEGKRYWSIDRDRDIYLRRAWIDWQCPSDEYWSFYWKGVEGCVRTFTLDFISEENGWSKESIRVGLSPVIMASGPEDVIRTHFINTARCVLARSVAGKACDASHSGAMRKECNAASGTSGKYPQGTVYLGVLLRCAACQENPLLAARRRLALHPK